jgi:hypothetical protein
MVAAPAAAHASGADVIRDCADDGRLDRDYSQADLRRALAALPADVDSYTDCRDIIRDARLGRAVRGGPAGQAASAEADPTAGAGGLTTDALAGATPAEREALQRAITGGARPVVVDGRAITPGNPAQAGAGGGAIPGPLAAVLGLLTGGALLGAGLRARRLLDTRGTP